MDHLQVAIFVLNCAEVEALEQTDHELLLLSIINLKLLEHRVGRNESLVNLPVKVLDRHKVLCCILQELVLQEFEPDTQSFATRSLHILSLGVSNCSLHHVILLWVLVNKAALCSHHSIEDRFNVFNPLWHGAVSESCRFSCTPWSN